MPNKLEKLVKLVYKKWRSSHAQKFHTHPDEEEFACFIEGKLSPAESQSLKAHLISCEDCAQAFAIQARLKSTDNLELPPELIARIKKIVEQETLPSLLEIILRFKDGFFELVKTSGDVLVGQELVPAPVLRSRQIKDFKDEITVLKDFQDIRVEIKIENKPGQTFNLIVMVKEKQTSKAITDLRITLIKDDLELESYYSDSGRVTFEHVLLGKYVVQISTAEAKIAHILLDIKT
jgi:hypothetical protein